MTTTELSDQELPDILGRPDIEKLVNAFYGKVRADAPLGHVFDGVAKVDWETHLPKIHAFWETVLFRTGNFRGSPLAVHLKLIEQTDMSWPLFERWLELFQETVTDNFAGENAGHIIRCAEDMARVIHSKIHTMASPRAAAGNLTPEQNARHAGYRETSTEG
ncbi:MAG: group III truncated hemoglobin [Verrucomicrobiaceae bacterium]|nr:MAG: group III truncated hemoglobin [Verrucomicrobiaceae bacterium]